MKHLIKLAFMSLLFVLTTQMSMAGAIHGKQFKDWQGRCQSVQSQELCFIIQVFSANGEAPLMITTVDVKRNAKAPIIIMRVSNKLDDKKEIMFKVDKNQPIGLKAECNEKECSVVFPLDKRMLSEFKRGARAVIGFIAKDTGKPVYLPISLTGFTKAFNTLKKS
ncbi:MAG: invasion protein IalB [Oceanospirillaceae bacterium]|jgi:invasion protein IalB